MIILVAVAIIAVLFLTNVLNPNTLPFLGSHPSELPTFLTHTPFPTSPPNVVSPTLATSILETSGHWQRNSDDLPEYVSTMRFSVRNIGNGSAENMNVNITADNQNLGVFYAETLPPNEEWTHYTVCEVTYDSATMVSAEVNCSSTSGSHTISLNAAFPRALDFGNNTNQTIGKLYVIPEEESIVALKNQIIKDKLALTPNWMALRDWVGNNIEYTSDSLTHQQNEYWQLPTETMQSGRGDCEDFSILLCSLLRADGWSQDNVHVILGEKDNAYHAWVRINWNGIQYNIEPQANGFATVIGDFLALSGYEGKYRFNDEQFTAIS